MPGGPPFALLEKPDSPWPSEVGGKADYQFRGYRLDEKRRPTFLYSFRNVEIEDYPLAEPAELDPKLRRVITVHTSNPKVPNLYFRAATGGKIEKLGDGTYLVDGKLRLKLIPTLNADDASPPNSPQIRATNGGAELIVPVSFRGGRAKFTEEIVW
jgi:hypothetical protein